MVTPADHSRNSSLMAKVQSKQSESKGSIRNRLGTGILYVGYSHTKGFPEVYTTPARVLNLLEFSSTQGPSPPDGKAANMAL